MFGINNLQNRRIKNNKTLVLLRDRYVKLPILKWYFGMIEPNVSVHMWNLKWHKFNIEIYGGGSWRDELNLMA